MDKDSSAKLPRAGYLYALENCAWPSFVNDFKRREQFGKARKKYVRRKQWERLGMAEAEFMALPEKERKRRLEAHTREKREAARAVYRARKEAEKAAFEAQEQERAARTAAMAKALGVTRKENPDDPTALRIRRGGLKLALGHYDYCAGKPMSDAQRAEAESEIARITEKSIAMGEE